MQSLIVGTLYLLTALIPLIFTVFNFELFEFPKFITLLAGTIIITIAWLTYAVFTRDWTLWPRNSAGNSENVSPFKWVHLAVVGVLATQFVTTLTSIHPYTSFWGYYSRFHQGFLTTVCYTVIYFAAVKWLDRKSTHKIIKISVNTAIVVSLIAILEHYNVSITCMLMTALPHLRNAQNLFYMTTGCWGNLTNPLFRSFSTLGQPNWLAAYLLLNVSLFFYRKRDDQKLNTVSIFGNSLSFAVLIGALLFTKSRSGFLGFGFAFLTYWIVSLRNSTLGKLRPAASLYFGIVLAMALAFGTPFTPKLTEILSSRSIAPAVAVAGGGGTVLETGGTESGDIRKIVWSGALKLIENHLFLGTGPETFAYTYYWERPVAHNYTSEWDYIYNKAHNEYLNMAATTGIFGLTAYLLWHYAIAAAAFIKIPETKKINKEKENDLAAYLPVLASAVIAFGVTNFFGFSVIPVYFLFTLISALPGNLNREPAANIRLPETAYAIFAVGALVLLYMYPVKLYMADYYFKLGRDSNSIPLLERAVSLRPDEDLFRSQLAETYAAYAASGDNKSKAIAQANITKAHNPFHLNYYKSRAKVYLTLAAVDPAYYGPAAEELARARQLAPTDPKLAYNLGLVYSRLGKIDQAEAEINQAIELKKDYQDAYYALTLIYEQTKGEDKIPGLLRNAQSNLATYSGLLQEKMDKYLTH